MTKFIPLAVVALWPFLLAPPAEALGVCADPDYLPFSNRAGEGFENKIAEAVAQALGEPLEYTWASTRGRGGFPQFLATTIDAKKCDVIMSLPYASREGLTTRPYYTSSYVFVFPKEKSYRLTSMNSPALKQLKVGFERETPAEDALKIRGLIPGSGAIGFEVGEDPKQSPEMLLQAIADGRIDVLITWQPAIGGFLRKYPGMEVVPIPNDRALGAPEQYSFPMSMGVRRNDEALKAKLDDVIEKHQSELNSILVQSGVLLYAQKGAQ